MIELIDINKAVSGEVYAQSINLRLESETINVLLGPTLSGKSSLMRILAGLDQPDSGDIRVNGSSVLGMPVQQRNIAMVYQQFINYPSLSVFENIASALRIAKLPQSDIDERVNTAAQQLQISDFLQRQPTELSGGQQQRVALARALVKRADLVLLDEPLANLDYKLREELREELPILFQAHGAVLVYATTEPVEALLLGGHTAVMHEGRVVQFGPTSDVFAAPNGLVSARAFSDPPLNTLEVAIENSELSLGTAKARVAESQRPAKNGRYTIGVRPHHIRLDAGKPSDIALQATVLVSEITGSESFIHLRVNDDQGWVALVHGVTDIPSGTELPCYIDPADLYYFNEQGEVAKLPQSVRAQ